MTNLDSILRSRDITLPTKVCLVKAMVFPVVMYGCESWTIKKAKHWSIDVFELWCWRRLLRVPWTARCNQSILQEISLGCSLEGLMVKLKLQYFGHIMWRVDSDAGRDWGQEKGKTEDEMAGWHYQLDESEWTLGIADGQGGLACCDSWGCKESDMTKGLNWTELSRRSSRPRDCIHVSGISCTAGRFFTIWATRETPDICICIAKSLYCILETIQHC